MIITDSEPTHHDWYFIGCTADSSTYWCIKCGCLRKKFYEFSDKRRGCKEYYEYSPIGSDIFCETIPNCEDK